MCVCVCVLGFLSCWHDTVRGDGRRPCAATGGAVESDRWVARHSRRLAGGPSLPPPDGWAVNPAAWPAARHSCCLTGGPSIPPPDRHHRPRRAPSRSLTRAPPPRRPSLRQIPATRLSLIRVGGGGGGGARASSAAVRLATSEQRALVARVKARESSATAPRYIRISPRVTVKVGYGHPRAKAARVDTARGGALRLLAAVPRVARRAQLDARAVAALIDVLASAARCEHV